MNVSEAILRTLLANGVEVCFGNPGTSEMHLVASFDRVGGMRPVLGLFEGVCTGAADGYARMADKPAATLLHLAPGLGNGFANLHNAWRGQSRMVNLVGDHATYHRQYDAPLQSDIHGVAKPFSAWIGDPASGAEAVSMTAEAVSVAMRPNGGIATLVVPADISWSDAGALPEVKSAPPAAAKVDARAIKSAAEALRAPGQKVLFVGGRAGRAAPLHIAGAIAAKTGAKLVSETFVPRQERGRGRARPERLAYLGEMALAQLQGTKSAVLVGAKAPVAFFAYPEKPSTFIPKDCRVETPWTSQHDVTEVLAALADELSVDTKAYEPPVAQAMAMKDGPLTGETLGLAFAALLPENAIVVDEAITGGLWAGIASEGAAPHDWLTLTGGAIGDGIPMAVGAKVACPGRPVIGLQADGSALYTIQGLWTAARENLHIVTILLNNRSYQILNMELDRVGATAQSDRSRSLLALDKPTIDFTSIAKGFGVTAQRATTAEEFRNAFKRALAGEGPQLIEAIIQG